MMNLLMAPVADSVKVAENSAASSEEFLIILGIVFGIYLFFIFACSMMNKQLKKVGEAVYSSYENELAVVPLIHVITFLFCVFNLVVCIPKFHKRNKENRTKKKDTKIKAAKEAFEQKTKERLKNIIDL